VFFYTRIYRFYFFFPEHYQDDGPYFDILFACMVSLYALQLYWGAYILRKMVKFLENPRIQYVCDQLCSTTSFLAVVVDVTSSASSSLSVAIHFLLATSASFYYANKTNFLYYVANVGMLHWVMIYRAYRLLPDHILYVSLLLHFSTFEIRIRYKDQMEWISSVAYFFDYLMIALYTQIPFHLFWLLTVQSVGTVFSQYTNCLRDMTYFVYFANIIASVYTFNQIFLACGV
jgi:hypothetical protein